MWKVKHVPSTVILDTANNKETSLTENADNITREDVSHVIDLLRNGINPGDVIVLAGTLPISLSTDIYSWLTEEAHNLDAEVVLATSGEPLRKALSAAPDLVILQKEELESFFNIPVRDVRDIVSCAQQMQGLGATGILITMPSISKAFLFTRQGHFIVDFEEISLGTSSGVWEALLAGFLVGQYRQEKSNRIPGDGGPPRPCLRPIKLVQHLGTKMRLKNIFGMWALLKKSTWKIQTRTRTDQPIFFTRAIFLGSSSSLIASAAIQRAVLSSIFSISLAVSSALPCKYKLCFPILRSAQLTALFYKISLISCRVFDHFQITFKDFVGGFLPIDGRPRHQRKACPPHKFLFPLCPFIDQFFCEWKFSKQVARHLVAQIPGVKIDDPGVGLVFGHLVRVIHHRSQEARFVNPAFPQPQSKRMVLPNLFSHRPQHRDANPQSAVHIDSKMRHPLCIIRGWLPDIIFQ